MDLPPDHRLLKELLWYTLGFALLAVGIAIISTLPFATQRATKE